MSANNEYRVPEHAEGTPAEPRQGAPAVLWVLLAFAVAAAALLWWSQSRPAGDTQPVVTTPASVVEDAQPDDKAAPTADKRAATRERIQPRRAPVAVNRESRPLAGNPEPKYPASMLRVGAGGTVIVEARIDARGTPMDVRVAKRSGERELDRAAVNAVRQWRFQPAMRNGKAVASSVRVPVDFKPI